MYDGIKHINFVGMQVFISPLNNYSRHLKSVRDSLVLGCFSVADSLCKLLENTPKLPMGTGGLFKVDSSYMFGM